MVILEDPIEKLERVRIKDRDTVAHEARISMP